MKKIAFIESASEMGGVEFSTLYLAAHLDRQKWQPVVICPREGMLASACRAENVEVQIIPAPELLPTSIRINLADLRIPNPFAWLWNMAVLWRGANMLRGFLAHTHPELIVTKGMSAHFLGGLAARLAKIRCVWHVQDFISERFFGLYRAVFGLATSILPDEIVVDGKSIANQLPARVQKNTFVILNGVDINIFRPNENARTALRAELNLPPQDLIIGHAARITPWKGQHHLLEAFGKIAAKYPNIRLLLVGAAIFDHDDYEKQLHTRAKELHLADRITFAGFRTDLANVLNAMDIFAYPSVEKDTSPLALLSALACGLPVVAFDIEGVQEVLGTSGMIVPVRDENKLAAALEVLINDSALREKMKNASREKALEKFSLEQYVRSMEKVFLQEI